MCFKPSIFSSVTAHFSPTIILLAWIEDCDPGSTHWGHILHMQTFPTGVQFFILLSTKLLTDFYKP